MTCGPERIGAFSPAGACRVYSYWALAPKRMRLTGSIPVEGAEELNAVSSTP